MDYDTITKNINKMTNKEKVTCIQTLLGISGHMAYFLGGMQEKSCIPLPAEIHYVMMISMVNLISLSKENETVDIVDFSADIDSDEEKLISILKQLNKIYKDKLNEI